MLLRQYDPSLQLTLERDYALCWQGHVQFQSKQNRSDYPVQKAIMDVIYGCNTSNTYEFIDAIQQTETQYLIFPKTFFIQDYLDSLGMKFVADSENYIIYNTQL